MAPWGWKAFVPKAKWVTPAPTITRVIPGHDSRLQSTVRLGAQEEVPIEIHFSSEMDCSSVADNLEIASTTQDGQVARLNKSSVACRTEKTDHPRYEGEIGTEWIFSAQLENVSNGVHTYTVRNATTQDGKLFTNVSRHFPNRAIHSLVLLILCHHSKYFQPILRY